MTKRVLLAGLLGGIAMYIWTFLAHEVLPLGEAGVKEMPNNEATALTAMRSATGDAAGFYFFPGMGLAPNATSQQKQAAMNQYQAKLDANPSGILIYHPPGVKMMTGGQLGTEFVTELIQALLAVFLMAQVHLLRYSSRVGFVLLIGVLAAITTNVSYWNWYGFPANYTIATIATSIMGFLCAGLVAAAIVKK